MGANIAYTVALVGVGQIVAGLPAVKGKFQHLHAGKAGVGQKLVDLRRQEAQVLGDDVQAVEPAGEDPHQIHARPFPPAAAPGGLRPVGHCPVALQAPEVVDTDDIEETAGSLYPADPPAEAIPFHGVVVVEGIAPQLSVGAEIIRRHTGNLCGNVALPQLEKLRFRPHVGGVHGHIDGKVADDLDAQTVDVFPQGDPLAVEEELEVAVEIHILLELLGVARHCLRLSQPDVLVRPLQPALHAEVALYRHIQSIVGQPLVFLPEGVHRLLVPGKALVESLAEDGEPGFIDLSVVHIPGLRAPVDGSELLRVQEPVLYQQVQINKVGVTGKGREALIGAVTVAGGAQRQKLPVLLTGGVEKIGKGVRLFAQGADAVRRGQGGDMQQDSAAAIHRDHPFCWDLEKVGLLALHGAGDHALDDVALAQEIDNDDGQYCQDDAGHHGAHLHGAVAAPEVLDQNGDGHITLGAVQHQVGQQVVVPYPHGLQDTHGDQGGFEDRHDHQEEGPHRAAAVDHGGLLDLQGNGLHKAAEHEHCQPCAEAQVDDADGKGGVHRQEGDLRGGFGHGNAQGVGQVPQGKGGADLVSSGAEGEHQHLEGHYHGENKEVVAGLAPPGVHTGDEPGAHGAEDEDQRHRGDRDEKGVAEGGQEPLGVDGVDIVFKAGKGIAVGQLESGGGGDGGLLFQRVEEDHQHRIDPGQTQDCQYSGENGVGNLGGFTHYCCTSLERVARSWIREMAMTSRQKSTALAWP